MKSHLQIVLTASTASVMAFSALALDTPTTKADRDRANYSNDRESKMRRANRLNDAAKASDIIGMTVKNYQDDKLGKVEDLAVDVESGRVVQVILSSGGLAGVGDRLTAVPPGALHHDVAQKVLHLNSDKESLKNAPKFEVSKWAEYSDEDHLARVYRHYGEEPAFHFVQKGDHVYDANRATREELPNTTGTRKVDGTWEKDRAWHERHSMIPVSRLAHLQKASKLMGTAVKNLQDEKLGKVENLLVDLPSGRIVALIVSTGGFLGLGDELSAVPPTALRYTSDRNTLQLDATKDSLSRSPHFQAGQWPDFRQPTYTEGVYRAYRVPPYFTTDADNTRRNVRDRDDRTLTPLDQGNSKEDIDISTRIRKEVLATQNLSVNAQNVKIITVNGRVTLRGPVNNPEEMRMINEIAQRIARSENVDNQLEVKSTKLNND